MCEERGQDKEREYHEDYGNILAQLDENKTNEQSQKEYDEKTRVW